MKLATQGLVVIRIAPKDGLAQHVAIDASVTTVLTATMSVGPALAHQAGEAHSVSALAQTDFMGQNAKVLAGA